ncbi:MAG: hypothetical protein AABY32_04000 [Nanoarchaeota archaeon]
MAILRDSFKLSNGLTDINTKDIENISLDLFRKILPNLNFKIYCSIGDTNPLKDGRIYNCAIHLYPEFNSIYIYMIISPNTSNEENEYENHTSIGKLINSNFESLELESSHSNIKFNIKLKEQNLINKSQKWLDEVLIPYEIERNIKDNKRKSKLMKIVPPKLSKHLYCPKCRNNIISSYFEQENIMFDECNSCHWDIAYYQGTD